LTAGILRFAQNDKSHWLVARATHLGNAAGTRLAPGTEMTAAAANHQAPDRPATAATGFSGALVNPQARLVVTGAALDVNVVAETGALELHCLV